MTRSSVKLIFGLFLCVIFAAVESKEEVETKGAYAVLDENGEDFLIFEQEPPRDKIVAGARFTNSINKTGY